MYQNYKSLKQNLQHQQVMVGTFVMEFAVPQMATILASAGADYLIVDLEHTMFSLQTVGSMIRAARGSDIPAIVRIPSIDRHFVSRSLDAGAAGLMVPRLGSAEDVNTVSQYAKFPPDGDRGVAFGIGHTDYGDFRQFDGVNLLQQSNQDLVLIGQIETVAGLDHLEEILDVGALDVIFIGLYDLSSSLGVSGELAHPKVIEAAEIIIETVQKRGVILGSYVNDFESGKRWLDAGVKMIAIGNDAFLVTCKFSEENQKFKTATG